MSLQAAVKVALLTEMVRYNESLSYIKRYLWGKWPIINSRICSLILNLKIKYQALIFFLKKKSA